MNSAIGIVTVAVSFGEFASYGLSTLLRYGANAVKTSSEFSVLPPLVE